MPEREYGLNRLELIGTIVKVSSDYIGELSDTLLVRALIRIPSQKEDKIVQVEAFETVGTRLIENLNKRVHLEGQVVCREHEGKYYSNNRIYEVWIKTPKEKAEEPSPTQTVEEDEVPF